MFTSSNRAVYGKISTFIPILCEYDIVNSVETMLVTAARINEALDKIRSVDFSIFYRDTTFSDPAHDITREFLKTMRQLSTQRRIQSGTTQVFLT